MKTAVLYQRVSSDEQALGHSLRDQRIRLEEYCQRLGIMIIGNFVDDFTGKTFERPGFSQMLKFIKEKRPNEILFIKWARFGRNTADAYVMIRKLHQMGVQVQAIDEPIDFSIPQSKIMLAIHLANPEVENDIRSDLTTRGIRRAAKEGRHTNRAPYGYINQRDTGKKAIIVIDPQKAPIAKRAFEMMATGQYSQQELRRILLNEGMRLQKSRFCKMLKNPVYCGKIVVKPYKGDKAQVVEGIHEAIISESLFYKVQDVIKGKHRNNKRKVKEKEEFHLKGVLHCQHDHNMTGSKSKGRNNLYAYYHCSNHFHCERYKADKVNKAFLSLLEEIKELRDLNQDSYLVLEYLLQPDKSEIERIQTKITLQEERIRKLQDNFIDGHITLQDYSDMRTRYEAELYDLKAKIGLTNIAEKELSEDLKNCDLLLSDLPSIYTEATLEKKQQLQLSLFHTVSDSGSIIKGHVYFDGEKCRTNILNPFISWQSNADNDFSLMNVLQEQSISGAFPFSSERGTLSRTIHGLKSLAEVKKLIAA